MESEIFLIPAKNLEPEKILIPELPNQNGTTSMGGSNESFTVFEKKRFVDLARC
jgi:hypothetical protein